MKFRLLFVSALLWRTWFVQSFQGENLPLHMAYQEMNELIDARISLTANLDNRISNNGRIPHVRIDDLKKGILGTSSPFREAIKQGCCVVDVGDHEGQLNDMWSVVQYVFDLKNQGGTPYRNEVLQRERSSFVGGYKYVHFTPAEESIKTLVGDVGFQSLGKTYQMLSSIASEFTSACLSLHHGINANDLVEEWMGGGHSFQRLARYDVPTDPTSTIESLRPHCDWSFVTLIPVSSVPGLQVYTDRGWERPETDGKNGVVLFNGKWLEILAGTPSTFHRVVVQDQNRPRWSAPFFFRPNNELKGVDIDPNWPSNQKLQAIRTYMMKIL